MSSLLQRKAARAIVLGGGWPRPSLDLDLRRLDSRITFTRASDGTYFDGAGVMKTASSNEARFDHDPATGESLGLLIEGARTNLFLQSEALGTTWTLLDITISDNFAVAPDGTTTMDAFVENANTARHGARQTVSVTNTESYPMSAFVRAGTRTWACFREDTASGASVYFNLSGAGSVGTVSAPWSNATIKKLGAFDIYLIQALHTVGSTASYAFALNAASGDGGVTYEGVNGDKAISAWGLQIEDDVAFPSSYIATAGASATRALDLTTISPDDYAPWLRQYVGTIVVEFRLNGLKPVLDSHMFYVSRSGGGNDAISIMYDRSHEKLRTYIAEYTVGASYETLHWTSEAEAGVTYSAGLAWAAGDHGFTVDGGAVLPGTQANIPLLADELYIGCQSTPNLFLYGTISRLRYWPRRLPDELLRRLTS